jgi:hypothetical protein
MTTIRCPACKADNATPPTCRRCKADLSLMWALEQQRTAHLIEAREAVADQRFDDALEELDAAETLRAGPDVRRYRACVHLLAGNFAEAMEEREIAKRMAGAS